ncbi:neutral zinc metallopeptidase [Nocardioides sp. Soil777]|uniref:neutral zinc metallopeptidase n=1 Tax=Nocardioides sp. Soil777 TaxID=1736409 RepID=UPI0009EB3905|nr:neutral zinc metallopeptidase [Nocardioides sp. Soil777]
MDRTRAKATVVLAALVLTSALTISPAEAAPVSEREARAKVTMKDVDGAVTGGTWAVKGKIARTGRAKNKTLIVEWKAGSSRFPTPGARTAVANKAGWARIGIKKRQNDGKYSIKFKSDTAGTSKIRVRLVAKGRTLDKSPVKTLTIVEAPPTPTTVPPVPAAPAGSTGLRSGLTGQVEASNPLMATYQENVYQNVANYWQANYNAWGYGTTTGYHYFPSVGEAIYDACTQSYAVDDTSVYFCPVSDYIIFPQQAAVNIWNGAYATLLGGTASAQPGDFAVAFTMAHEFGHNITWELWPNAGQVFSKYQTEGFADCLAGTWAYSAYYQGILEGGDIEEAIAMLISFGYSSAGYPSGEERAQFFMYGYNTGSPADCAQVIL